MIDKGLYKNRKDLRVGGVSGREYDKPSSPAPKASKPTSFSGNEDRQQYSATQTRTGTVKSGGPTDRFISGKEGRKARDAFIKAQGPDYTGGSRFDREPSRIKQFFSNLFGMSPLTGILRGLTQNIRNTDFGRSKNLMDYLDIRKFGGYDEREMARKIRMQEAANLQDRIDAGEFGGIGSLDFGDTTVPRSSYDMAGVNTPFAQQAPEEFISELFPNTNIYNQQDTKYQKRPEQVETEMFFSPQLKSNNIELADDRAVNELTYDQIIDYENLTSKLEGQEMQKTGNPDISMAKTEEIKNKAIDQILASGTNI